MWDWEAWGQQALHLSPLLDRGELLIEGKGGGMGWEVWV